MFAMLICTRLCIIAEGLELIQNLRGMVMVVREKVVSMLRNQIEGNTTRSVGSIESSGLFDLDRRGYGKS